MQGECKDRALRDGNMGQLVREGSGEDAIQVGSRRHGKSQPKEDETGVRRRYSNNYKPSLKKLNHTGVYPIPFVNGVPNQRNFARFLNDRSNSNDIQCRWVGKMWSLL